MHGRAGYSNHWAHPIFLHFVQEHEEQPVNFIILIVFQKCLKVLYIFSILILISGWLGVFNEDILEIFINS